MFDNLWASGFVCGHFVGVKVQHKYEKLILELLDNFYNFLSQGQSKQWEWLTVMALINVRSGASVHIDHNWEVHCSITQNDDSLKAWCHSRPGHGK